MSDSKNQALYSVIFDDNTHFVGGHDYHNTRWLEIPDKKIKRIFYRLPDGNFLTLHGYDKYYHMVEAVTDIMGKERGKVKIEYAYIMGKRRNKVTSYRITLFNKPNDKYKLGDIVRREFDKSNVNIKKLNSKGWR